MLVSTCDYQEFQLLKHLCLSFVKDKKILKGPSSSDYDVLGIDSVTYGNQTFHNPWNFIMEGSTYQYLVNPPEEVNNTPIEEESNNASVVEITTFPSVGYIVKTLVPVYETASNYRLIGYADKEGSKEYGRNTVKVLATVGDYYEIEYLAAGTTRKAYAPKSYISSVKPTSISRTFAYSSPSEFISMIAPYAKIVGQKYDILLSIIIAQACLESSFGAYREDDGVLSMLANAPFGVKATGWNGRVYGTLTGEYRSGNEQVEYHDFRAYDSLQDALDDHARLLASSTYNAPGQAGIKGEKDYKVAAKLLIDNPTGYSYATDPNYTSKVINMIEERNLTQYD